VTAAEGPPAVRCGHVAVKPAIERLGGGRVRFVDGSEERIDQIVSATGYRISLPLPLFLAAGGRRSRLVAIPPDRSSGSAGAVSRQFRPRAGGLLPVVDTQGEWIATVLTGRLRLPPRAQMWRAIARADRQRFPHESPGSVRCDPHAYRRLLQSDLRRARRRVWHAATASRAGKEATVRPVHAQREQPAA
jgi:Flavin-binding monooxygenase-like